MIKVRKVDGERNPADFMTKAMGKETMLRLMSKMGVRHEKGRAAIAPEVAEDTGGEEAFAGNGCDSLTKLPLPPPGHGLPSGSGLPVDDGEVYPCPGRGRPPPHHASRDPRVHAGSGPKLGGCREESDSGTFVSEQYAGRRLWKHAWGVCRGRTASGELQYDQSSTAGIQGHGCRSSGSQYRHGLRK